MCHTTSWATAAYKVGTHGRGRTDTKWLLRPLPLPLGYVCMLKLVQGEGFEPSLIPLRCYSLEDCSDTLACEIIISMICPQCQKEHKNPKFCSRSCAATFTNSLTPKRKTTRICRHEGCQEKIAYWQTTFCKYHKSIQPKALKDRTIGELRSKNSLKAMHRSSANAHIGLHARYHHKKLKSGCCFNCGYNKHVELCHIKAKADFLDAALLSEVNDISNVMPLCPNCHWEFDNELLPLIADQWAVELKKSYSLWI